MPPEWRAGSNPKTLAGDFAALEMTLRREAELPNRTTIMSPDRMVVELRLTPEKARDIEARGGIDLRWVDPVYSAMKRHGLYPERRTSWETWLKKYHQRRLQLGLPDE